MADWVGSAAGGDVTVKAWLEVGGMIVLSSGPDAAGNYVPVAKNTSAQPDLQYIESNPHAKAVVAFELDVSAASVPATPQTLWHRAEQGGQALPAYDDALNPVALGPNGGIALPPDCQDNQREQRWFTVRFR